MTKCGKSMDFLVKYEFIKKISSYIFVIQIIVAIFAARSYEKSVIHWK